MNVTLSTNQTSQNFQGFYAPRTLRLNGEGIKSKELLKFPSVKECAEKFDVVIKQGKKSGTYTAEERPILGCGILAAHLSAAAAADMAAGSYTHWIIGIFVGMPAFISTIPVFARINEIKLPKYDYEINGRKKYQDGSEISAPIHKITSQNIGEVIPNMTDDLEVEDKKRFLKLIVSKFPKNGVYDVKNILDILQSKEIRNDFNKGEAFNYNIDIKGNTTLLTKFFEQQRTEENKKDYDKIISIIKSTPNVNFNQKDYVGISIPENILNLENFKALDLIKDVEFEYSKDLDTLYNNIQNEEFKSKAKNLKIKFDDPEKALFEEKSMKAFKEAVTQLDSPFCDSQKIASDIWFKAQERLDREELKEVSMILYKYLPEPLRIN